MALYDTISAALGDNMANNGEEISLKIKPAGMAAGQASNEVANGTGAASAVGTGGANQAGGGAAPMSLSAPAPAGGLGAGGSSIVPAGQRLSNNLQLVSPPMGAYTDAEFEAQLAQARQQMQTEYMGILQQLGFVDASGAFIPGTVETGAARQRADLQHGQGLAVEEVTGNARRGNTVFSGRRIQNQANAEHPFVAALSKLEADTPLALGNLFQQAAGLKSQFESQLNVLLAEAAARQAAAIRENPAPQAKVGADDAGPGGGGGSTPGPFQPDTVYRQDAQGNIIPVPQGWMPLPGENLYT